MKIFVVVPFYNEKKHIGLVVKSLIKYNLPIVVVDDGSTDGSQDVVKNLGIKNVTLLRHKINLGKGAAMKTGAIYAFSNKAEAVIFMDGDSQHDPNDLNKFIELLKSGRYGAVFGTRNYGYNVPLIRFLGNKFVSVMLSIMFHIFVSDVLCGFKAITKSTYDKISWDSSGYGVETEIVVRVGRNKINFCETPVKTIYHDKTKGVTILDAFGVLAEIIKWRFTI